MICNYQYKTQLYGLMHKVKLSRYRISSSCPQNFEVETETQYYFILKTLLTTILTKASSFFIAIK